MESTQTASSEEDSCLVCDRRLSVARSTNVYRAAWRRNGETLVKFILRILRASTEEIRSAYICSRCFELFGSLERAQRTVNSTKREILKVYRSSGGRLSEKTKDRGASEGNEREELEESELRREESVGESLGNCEKTFFPAADFVEARSNTEESRCEEETENFAARSGEEIRAGGEESWENSAPPKEIPGGDGVEESVEARCDSGEESKRVEPTQRGSWKSGRISKYSQKPLKYSCGSCDKKWRTLAELKTHVRSHSNLRPYMCEKCGRAYKHKHALEIHVGMHSGVSPFRCSVCDKCFTQKGALMRHLPMHTGETPYQCELCGKRFVHHTSYNMHSLSHTGKKSYRCHLCDLSLLSTSHLKRHMRVHTGEKPYSCSLCGKSFAERYNLFAHRKIHDPAEIMSKESKKITFKCDRCDDYFDEEEKLERHKIEHGSDDGRGGKLFSSTYDVNLTNRNAELAGIGRDEGGEVEEAWGEIDYEKFDNSKIVSITQQTDNEIIVSKALTFF